MKTKFAVFITAVVLLVVGLGVFTNKPAGPSRYEPLVKSLVAEGVQFFGAFWCSHCQAQEAALEMSRQQLESVGLYKECSNPDQSSTQICIDNKIESFPTWKFKNGITINSKSEPVVCGINDGTAANPAEPALCTSQVKSKYYKTWIFPEYKFTVKSLTEPTHESGVWKFPGDSVTTGELPIDFLAEQVGFTMPQ